MEEEEEEEEMEREREQERAQAYCAVCLEVPASGTSCLTTPCGHSFCTDCLKRWCAGIQTAGEVGGKTPLEYSYCFGKTSNELRMVCAQILVF